MSFTEDEEEQFKRAVKEAAHEWLRDQFSAFGKWSAVGISSAVFMILVKVFIDNGGSFPK